MKVIKVRRCKDCMYPRWDESVKGQKGYRCYCPGGPFRFVQLRAIPPPWCPLEDLPLSQLEVAADGRKAILCEKCGHVHLNTQRCEDFLPHR
jgi:hypothetical protein